MACVLVVSLVVLVGGPGLLVGGGVLIWLAAPLVGRRLEGNPEAARALADHVIIPLMVGKYHPVPEAQKVKGFMV